MSNAKNIVHFNGDDSWPSNAEPLDMWQAVKDAAEKIAPVWPLENFVAVNPYLGFMDKGWDAACAELSLVAGTRSAMDIAFYEDELQNGTFSVQDVRSAIEARGETISHQELWARLREAEGSKYLLPLMSDLYGAQIGIDATDLILNQISAWAAGFYDEGQAKLPFNVTDEPMFENWLARQKRDKGLVMQGLTSLDTTLAGIEAGPIETADRILKAMDLPQQLVPMYLHRLARSVGGWMAYSRYKDWPSDTDGMEVNHASTLLTIRLIYDWHCYQWLVEHAGQRVVHTAYKPSVAAKAAAALRPWLIIQEAYENGIRRNLSKKFTPIEALDLNATAQRPELQAAFCIDVRSEVYRRALEQQSQNIETIGFAGFFGLSLDVNHVGSHKGNAHCPVLLQPQYIAKECAKQSGIMTTSSQQDAVSPNWFSFQSFRASAVSSFAFVESFGLLYVARAITDALGITKPASVERSKGIAGYTSRENRSYELLSLNGKFVPIAEKAEIAKNILTGMSLTDNFAKLVFLVGHGSTSVNNPHAAGLDCGACGGNSGAPNAQVVAGLLNDPDVRGALVEKGVTVPEDTVFVAALHDTATDRVIVLNSEAVPVTHKYEFDTARRYFDAASAATSSERAMHFTGADRSKPSDECERRSNDWSEVRPEWGLAGCKAFVAAPRQHTRAVNLDGHAFLHSYDHKHDANYQTLELIMTAPMIVASWINLQYYGSTVDNPVFGSGDKTLHNVVGRIGVLEGGSGDLRVGLPVQSLHDGVRWLHKPARLSVVLRAPVEAINGIIQKHEMVRQLADNKWLYLYAMDDDGSVRQVYEGGGFWSSIDDNHEAQSRTVA